MTEQLDLRHYSDHAIEDLLKSSPFKMHPGKPSRGVWVSVGDEWEQWCTDQGFMLDDCKFEHKVTLKPAANILYLSTAEELRQFSIDYKGEGELNFGSHVGVIDWPRVAEKYQGIIINPYQYSCRLDPPTFWYYGWDVASGCIWDIEAIAKMELITAELPGGKL